MGNSEIIFRVVFAVCSASELFNPFMPMRWILINDLSENAFITVKDCTKFYLPLVEVDLSCCQFLHIALCL